MYWLWIFQLKVTEILVKLRELKKKIILHYLAKSSKNRSDLRHDKMAGGAVSNIITFLCLYFLEIYCQMAHLIAAGIIGHIPAVNYLKTCLTSVKPLKEKRHLF